MGKKDIAMVLAVLAYLASIPLVFAVAVLSYANGRAAIAYLLLPLVFFLFIRRDANGTWWRRAPRVFAGLLLIPIGSAWFGTVISGEAEDRQRSDEARYAAEDREARERSAQEAARLAAEATRAAEAARRAAQEEARRTPEERATLIRSILAGRDSAETPALQQRVCRARLQLTRIAEEARRLPSVRLALVELARAEREALREEREAFRETRMVMCCDGATSPTCTCRRASHRGCCSHHGGMCGCEPLPTEIFCSR